MNKTVFLVLLSIALLFGIALLFLISSEKEHFQTTTTPCTDPTLSPFPTGLIILWNGAENAVPSGWALCNGANNTPDLRGRFVLGFNPESAKSSASASNYIRATGGEEMVTLTVSQLPSHRHSYTEGGEYRVCSGCQGHEVGDNPWDRLWYQNTAETGNSTPHSNMPPYYVLAYIMKL